HEGEGMPKNLKEAEKWIRKAAEQGSAKAQYNLGLIYHEGEGMPKNLKEAARWFRKAAEQGLSEATKALEILGVVPPPAAAPHIP
ncbi:MAG: sel1 repeat family protein, partial [Holosporales bacterium]|nr:sel1 repeat family protein [Holosporales bacterium]